MPRFIIDDDFWSLFPHAIACFKVNGSLNFPNQLDRRNQLISLNRIMFRRHSHHTSFFNNSVKNNKDSRQKVSSLERKCETPAGKTCQGETPQAQRCRRGFRDRTLKASAWSGNQHPNGTGKNCRSNHIDMGATVCRLSKSKPKLIGEKGARLLREKRVQGRPGRRKGAEEASGPPAESECLERKSTSK
ncbi:hypothetical protein J2Y73_004711 [Peribacillus frigoritolerans]|nr:hypothetical protein [Peribacillus frigoritolerans]